MRKNKTSGRGRVTQTDMGVLVDDEFFAYEPGEIRTFGHHGYIITLSDDGRGGRSSSVIKSGMRCETPIVCGIVVVFVIAIVTMIVY